MTGSDTRGHQMFKVRKNKTTEKYNWKVHMKNSKSRQKQINVIP